MVAKRRYKFLEPLCEPVWLWTNLFPSLHGWAARPVKDKDENYPVFEVVGKAMEEGFQFRIFPSLGMGFMVEHRLACIHPDARVKWAVEIDK